MRLFAFVLFGALTLSAGEPAKYDLFACAFHSKGWVAGLKLQGSGVFYRWSDSVWTRTGFNHPIIETLDYDPRDPRVLYIAAGNGLFRSHDSGHTWRLTTGQSVTELRDVSVDPNRPDDVYIGTTDGIAATRDAGATWKRVDPPVKRRFTKTLRVDRTRAGRVLAGTEQHIVLTEDGGLKWKIVADAPQPTHIEQSPHDARYWLATTQSGGLLESRDGGLTWLKNGLVSKGTLYQAAFDPLRKGRIAVAEWEAGIWLSNDGGATWKQQSTGLPSKQIWRVVFDPVNSGRMYASVHEEALYVSEDAGITWRREGLHGSVVNDLVYVPKPKTPASREQAFRQRIDQVIDHFANPPDLTATGFGHIAAMLHRGKDVDWASKRLIELLKDPTGDMFWMFPVTAIAFRGEGKLTHDAQKALRHAWKTYMPYRGDTENHWLLYYTCLYLMSEHWPNEPGSEWYTGKSSEENRREAEEWIRGWMDLTVTRGQGEYDCTHYLGVFLMPMSYLAEWASDPEMKQRARMMLDWLIADYAAENLDGLYVGAHARTDDRNVLEKWYGVGSDFGWLLFGMGYPFPGYSYGAFYYTMASAYFPPEVIHNIATDRTRDYVHKETKRTRHRWRFHDERNGDVYKTTYMRREYAVGSDQGGILQPIQQHSWDVTWTVPDPRGVHNTMFSIHPYSSIHELQTYFSPLPDFLTESVVRSKRTYDSADKFLGGSPYEQIMQDLDTVIALYNIPPGTRWPHIQGFFSKDLARVVEHSSGWIFAQGGNTYLAYRPLAPYEWRDIDYHELMPAKPGGRSLFSPHLKNGTVVQAAAVSEFPSFDAFQQAIAALPFEAKTEPVPSVMMRSLRGKDLSFTWGQKRDWSGWKAFDSIYMQSERGSRRLVLKHGVLQRTLDFTTLSVTDQPRP